MPKKILTPRKTTPLRTIPIKKIIPTPRIENSIMDPPTSTEKMLVENFVSLQKVMTHLSIKFEDLSTQISRLLELFEISAKSIAGKEFNTDKIEKKLDNLVEQNKVIARGVALMHEPPEDFKQESPSRAEREKPNQRRFKPWPK